MYECTMLLPISMRLSIPMIARILGERVGNGNFSVRKCRACVWLLKTYNLEESQFYKHLLDGVFIRFVFRRNRAQRSPLIM